MSSPTVMQSQFVFVNRTDCFHPFVEGTLLPSSLFLVRLPCKMTIAVFF